MSERGINPLDLSFEQLSAYRTQVNRTTYYIIILLLMLINYYSRWKKNLKK